MKKLLRGFAIVMFAISFSFSGYAATVITVSDTIRQNTTWSADTVKVTGDIRVTLW